MPWARLEDSYWCNPKIADAGNEAAGIYARALSYCAQHSTGGYVPTSIAVGIASSSEANAQATAISALERNGLWRAVKAGTVHRVTGRRDSGNRPLDDVELTIPNDGYLIPDFLHFHLSKRETEEKRSKRLAAAQAGGKANAQADAQANAKQMPKQQRTPHARGNPSHPILMTTSSGADDDEREKIEAACDLLGFTQNQRARAATTEPELLLAIAGHALATGSNPGGLAWTMLTTGQDPRSSTQPTLAAGATGTRSTSKPADALDVCRKWIAGQAWDDSYDLDAASEELQRVARKARADLDAPALATLLEEWHAEHARRHAVALVEGVTA